MNKFNKKTIKGFSLIELSVVIVIVMVMIAGLLQSSRIIGSMRINTARNVTQSSAMPWVNYIVSWQDSTAEDAFKEEETDDGDKISRWNGAEVRYSDRINFIQNTADNQPMYKANGMFGLPSVLFDGTNDFFESERSEQDVLTYRSASIFGAFEVTDVNSTDKRTIFFNPADTCGMELEISHNSDNKSGNLAVSSNGGCGGTPNATSSPFGFFVNNEKVILSIIIYSTPTDLGSTANIKFFKNGYLQDSNQVGSNSYNSAIINSLKSYSANYHKFYLGSTKATENSIPKNFFKGIIGELIIFNRSVNNDDRKEIERYLGRKWGVKVNYGL
ncbi:MAG: prepilin-type N-terminal cleavage/methylation domain-containing protein [Rickettsiales bacterium]